MPYVVIVNGELTSIGSCSTVAAPRELMPVISKTSLYLRGGLGDDAAQRGYNASQHQNRKSDEHRRNSDFKWVSLGPMFPAGVISI